ncbi:MAG: hypothetical protein KDD69_03970 [Bdellovibrionales bacterium]|nr:hypothetical protein [Bdellovibrionales bacterium]
MYLRLLSRGCCILAVCMLWGCDNTVDDANRAAADLQRTSQEYVVKPVVEGFQEHVAPIIEGSTAIEGSSAVEGTMARLDRMEATGESAAAAVKSVEQTVEATKETVQEAKTSVQTAAEGTKQTLRALVRQAPRSRKEANQLVEAKGRSYFDWIREKMNAFVEKNQLRRQNSKTKRSS